jgi:hypothetical protein
VCSCSCAQALQPARCEPLHGRRAVRAAALSRRSCGS